jgi:hypothetical protein
VIEYEITGLEGDNWAGTFDVTDPALPVYDTDGSNVDSVDAAGLSPVTVSQMGTTEPRVFWIDENDYGLFVRSADLYDAIGPGTSTTWNDLVGQVYELGIFGGASFYNGTGELGGMGRPDSEITFSSSSSIPEPGALSLLAVVGLILLARRNRAAA